MARAAVIGPALSIAGYGLAGAEIPASVVCAGAPAKVKKPLEGEAANWIEIAAKEYVHLSRTYLNQDIGDPRLQQTD